MAENNGEYNHVITVWEELVRLRFSLVCVIGIRDTGSQLLQFDEMELSATTL